MPERDEMDALLRQLAAGVPEPRLSAGFDEGLKKRMRPRRLDDAGRAALAVYGVVALIVCLVVMRGESIEWSTVVLAIALPLVVVGILARRQAIS